MFNFYMMWLYALQFVTCRVSVDAFSLLYSSYCMQNWVYLFQVLILLNLMGKLLAYVAIFIRD